MKTIAILAGLAAAALSAGCDSSSDAGKVSPSEETAPASSEKASVDAGGHPLSAPTADPGTLTFETELIRLVNDYRASKGLPALVDSSTLRDSARANSQHMIVHEFFSHTSPEGLSPGDRITQNGIAWTSVGENIAAGYATPQAVFDAWLASPGHRQNIESERWTHTGVGYALDRAPSDDFPHTHLWTQDFVQAPQ
jgi:uncharacterized protein YkwD